MAWFEFNVRPGEAEVSVLSMGDLTIVGTEGIATTHGNGGYSMMVFLSIFMFLDIVQNFFLNPTQRSSRACEFSGVDGSFQAQIIRAKPDGVVVKVFGDIISRESDEQFIRELWQSVEPFVSHHRNYFDEAYNPNQIKDLDESMREFAEAFADILNDN